MLWHIQYLQISVNLTERKFLRVLVTHTNNKKHEHNIVTLTYLGPHNRYKRVIRCFVEVARTAKLLNFFSVN